MPKSNTPTPVKCCTPHSLDTSHWLLGPAQHDRTRERTRHKPAGAQTEYTNLQAPKTIEPSANKFEKTPGERGRREFENPNHGRRGGRRTPSVAGRRRDGGGLYLPLPLLAPPNYPPSAAPPRAATPGQRRRDRRPVQLRQVPPSPHGKRSSIWVQSMMQMAPT